jgi:predicted DNA-binding antitoxin AbrB/MazE fold protein
MDQTIQAVFEHGVLRPLTPLPLREDEIVSVTVTRPNGGEPEAVVEARKGERHREIVMQFIAQMELMPDHCPQDGLTNRDHDRLIYGS